MPLPQGFHTHCFLPWMFTLINPNISNSKSGTFSEPWLLNPQNPESALNIDTICEYWGLRWALLVNSCFFFLFGCFVVLCDPCRTDRPRTKVFCSDSKLLHRKETQLLGPVGPRSLPFSSTFFATLRLSCPLFCSWSRLIYQWSHRTRDASLRETCVPRCSCNWSPQAVLRLWLCS